MHLEPRFADVELSTGVRLHLARCGSTANPPLVLLHGFPEFWAAWAEVMPLLGEHFDLLVPDLRGFNRSDKPGAIRDYRAGLVAADICALMDAFGYREAYVAGHDWGGVVAWALAIRHPDRVAALGICNAPHPYLFAQALARDPAQQKASAYMDWLRRSGSDTALLKDDCALLERFFLGPGTGNATPPAWWDAQRRALYREAWTQPGAILAGTHYYRAAPKACGDAAMALEPEDFHVQVPTLVLWGEKDEALLCSLLDGLEDFVARLWIKRMPQASHWLLHEEPALVAEALRNHFEAHPIGTARR